MLSQRTHKSGGGHAKRPISRSGSFLGAIKNVVSGWLGSTVEEDFEDTAGKRRRVVPDEQQNQGGPKSKRMRVDSPDREVRRRPGYNDPPRSAFPQHQPQQAPQYGANAFTFTYTTKGRVQTPHHRAVSAQANRHTLPPPPGLARTMSMDPPSCYHDASMVPLPPTPQEAQFRRDSLVDGLRDVSMAPGSPARGAHTFRIRSSLTPQPLSFVEQREKSIPPPLTTLQSHPVFVRPPPQGQQKPVQREPSVTLGTLAEDYRRARSPLRQHTSLVFESNAAERALHELDVYKTPLLPSRLRTVGTKSVPDMFRSLRKSHAPKLMSDANRRTSASFTKSKPEVNESKPYAGEGGMKKLLARRKLEADEEREKAEQEQREKDEREEDDEMDNDKDSWEDYQRIQKTKRLAKQNATKVREVPPPNPIPEGGLYNKAVHARPREPAPVAGSSSLRVGRTKNRNHIDRPSSRPGRFSASTADDDADEEGDEEVKEEIRVRSELDEAAKNVPVFKVPAGFSFAKPGAATSQQDYSKAKEPPVASLPFSFSPSPAPSAPLAGLTPRPLPSLTPTIALAPATPEPPKEEAAAPVPAVVPNFFAKPAAPLNIPKHVETPASAPSFSFGAPAEAPKPQPAPVVAPPSEPKPVDPVKLAFGFPQPAEAKVVEAKVDAPATVPNFFGASLGVAPAAPAVPVTDAGTNPFWDGKSTTEVPAPLSAPTPAPAPAAFSWGASAAKPDTALAPAFSFSRELSTAPATEAPKASPFTFGATKAPESVEAPKSLPFTFGASTAAASTPAPSQFSFGASSAPPAAEPSKSVFAFGTSAAPPTPSAEAPRSLFGGPPSTSSMFGAPPSQPKDNGPFGFGAAPATPPAAEKKSVLSFGPSPATPVAPTEFSFGPTPTASVPTFGTSSAPFSFGASVPARASTPPAPTGGQEFSMEESPSRETQAKPPTAGGFSFGASSSFGQSAPSSSGFGASSAPASGGFGGFGSGNPSFPVSKPEETSGMHFRFSQQSQPAGPALTPFSFGGSQADPSSRPSSSSSFTFGGSAPAPANNGFGAAPANTTFSHPAPSAPGSPSTFNSPFAFGAPTQVNTSFGGFGSSQPGSPATGPASLPRAPGSSSGFGGGFGQPSQPSSPFNAPAQVPPPAQGGALFTMGSAPAPANGAPRQLKKLPSRRGTAPKR